MKALRIRRRYKRSNPYRNRPVDIRIYDLERTIQNMHIGHNRILLHISKNRFYINELIRYECKRIMQGKA